MNFDNRPALNQLVAHLLGVWPTHINLLAKSFANRTPATLDVSELLSSAILKLAKHEPDGLDGLCADYRYMCEDIFLPEEVHFRRNGRYRLASFAEANAACYANAPLMARYMNGLLVSNVMWVNHASAFAHFANDFLGRLSTGARHLEIGPGHGLFLYFASRCPQVTAITGWDISPTSIDRTRRALALLGAPMEPTLVLQDMFKIQPSDVATGFDSVVMSEILEHLEDPVAALKAACNSLKPGGLMFVNVPANSPAPDHIFLVESPEHAASLVSDAGLTLLNTEAFPMSGTTMAQARKHKLTVSCVVIAQKPYNAG